MRSRKPGMVEKLHARFGPVLLMLPWKEVEVLGAFISNICYVDSVWICGLEIGTKPQRSQQQCDPSSQQQWHGTAAGTAWQHHALLSASRYYAVVKSLKNCLTEADELPVHNREG